MSTRARGVSDHKMAENFEKFHKRLTEEFGFTGTDAIRGAAALTALSDPACTTREQVWEATDAILGTQTQTTNQRRHDGN